MRVVYDGANKSSGSATPSVSTPSSPSARPTSSPGARLIIRSPSAPSWRKLTTRLLSRSSFPSSLRRSSIWCWPLSTVASYSIIFSARASSMSTARDSTPPNCCALSNACTASTSSTVISSQKTSSLTIPAISRFAISACVNST